MKTETIKSEIKATLKYVSRKDYNLYVLREMLNQLTIMVNKELSNTNTNVGENNAKDL